MDGAEVAVTKKNEAEIVQDAPAALAKHDVHAPNPYDERAITPMDLIQRAIEKGATVEQIDKLVDLKLRLDAHDAKKAYDAAMTEFKKQLPIITKNRKVEYTTEKGTTKYNHTSLDHLCDLIVPRLSEFGFSHKWKTHCEPGFIRVTCVITHRDGHSEDSTMSAGPDGSGGKNAIQGIGSTTSYLERYTFFAILGLAPKGQDNDGLGDTTPKYDKLAEDLADIAAAPSLGILKETFGKAWNAAKKARDTDAQKQLVAAKDEKRKEFGDA